MKAGEKAKGERKDDAEKDGSTHGDEDGDVPAAVSDLSAQTAKRQAQARGQQQTAADENQQDSETRKRFAKFGHARGPFTARIQGIGVARVQPRSGAFALADVARRPVRVCPGAEDGCGLSR